MRQKKRLKMMLKMIVLPCLLVRQLTYTARLEFNFGSLCQSKEAFIYDLQELLKLRAEMNLQGADCGYINWVHIFCIHYTYTYCFGL